MRRKPAFQQLTFAVALLATLGSVMVAEVLADPQTAPAAAADAPAPLQAGPLQIIGLCNAAGQQMPLDHASIIRTVRQAFGVRQSLTRRDAAAPSVLAALSLAGPNNDGPPSVPVVLGTPTLPQVTDRAQAAPNGMQASLAAAAMHLPTTAPASDAEVPASQPQAEVEYPTVATAQAAAVARTNQFFGLTAAAS